MLSPYRRVNGRSSAYEGRALMKIVAVATNVIRSTVEWAIGAMYSSEYSRVNKVVETWTNDRAMVCRLRTLAELKARLYSLASRSPSHGTASRTLTRHMHGDESATHYPRHKSLLSQQNPNGSSIHPTPRPLISYCVLLHTAAPHKRVLGSHRIWPP